MNPWQSMYGNNWPVVCAVYFVIGLATVVLAVVLVGHQMGFL